MANSKELSQLAGVVTVASGVVSIDGKLSVTAGTDPDHVVTKSQVDALVQAKDQLSELSGTTDDITEGSTNLYYTDARVGSYLTANSYATTTDISNAVNALIDAAPSSLDTLNELAAALGDDSNFASTVTTSIATKLNSADFDSTFDTRLATKTTDDVTEGEGSNLYYTDARVNSNFAAKTTDDLTEGSTNLYYTDARVEAAITVDATLSKTGGQISMPASGVTAGSYGSASAVPVFTVDEQGRITSASTTAVAGVSGFSYTSATNTYTITTSAGTSFDATGDLTSFDTGDLTEGSNLYYTEARVDANIAGKTTDDIAEGSTNLYYTDTRARSSISLTDAGGEGSMSYNSTTGVITYTGPSATELLTAIKTVDGSTSGLDADLLDGQNGSYYLDWTNTTNKPDPVVTVTLTGDVTGTANTTLTDLASGTVTVATTIAANSVTLGTDTTGNYMVNVSGGTGVSVSHTQGEGSTATVSIGQAVATTSDVTFNTVTTDYIDLTTSSAPSHQEGRIFYDTSNKSLAVYNDESDITLQIGQESWVRVYNSSGSAIPNGAAVSFYGSTAGTPLIILADSSDYNKIRWVAGFSTHTIENNSYGYVTTFGKVNDLDTSAYSIGSAVYVSATTPGGLTPTPPSYPNYAVLVGGVVAVDASAGAIFVNIQNSVFPTLQVNADARIDGGLVIAGDLTVLGGTTTVTTSNLAVADNMIYMNQGVEANIMIAVGNGTSVTYTTVNDHNYQTGWSVSVTEITPSSLNGYGMTITGVTDNTFTVEKATTDTYVSGGVARAKSSTNPDIGFAGGYNDGAYHHTGLFRDASDGYWKFFQGYEPEPDSGPHIDTNDASFELASIRVDGVFADSITATSITGELSGNAATASQAERLNLGSTGLVYQTDHAPYTYALTNTSYDYATEILTIGGIEADLSSGGVTLGGLLNVIPSTATISFAGTIVASPATGDITIGTGGNNLVLNGFANTFTYIGNDVLHAGNAFEHAYDILPGSSPGQMLFAGAGAPYWGDQSAIAAGSAAQWTTARTLTLSGDVAGSASIDGSGDITLYTAVALNSVALGIDTTGDYLAGVTAGSYITISGTAGEGWNPTISADADWANTPSKLVARDAYGNFSAGTITASLSGNASTATSLQTSRTLGVTLTGDVTGTGSASFNGSGDAQISFSTTVGDNSHNHTSLSGVTSIGFAAQSSDSASISTTINGTGTYFDFNLTDDNNNDWWRWRFTPSGSTVYDAMTLTPVANGVANLGVAGTITATTFVGSLDWSNVANKPDPVVTVTLTGDVTGTANTTLTDLASGTVTVATTIAANSVALGTDTTGNYMVNVAAGTGISVSHTQGEGSTATITNSGVTSIVAGNAITISGATGAVTVNHADTSSVANLSSDNSNGVVLQDISLTFDTYGHVTAASASTVNLDSRFVNITGDTMTGTLNINSPSASSWALNASTPGKTNYSGIWFTSDVGELLLRNSAGTLTTRISADGSNAFINNQNIFTDAYHPNADKWTTSRTLSLTGDVTGSVSIDGSGNVSMSTTVADNSHNHNSLYRVDNRTISPSETSAGYGEFGFTSWNNNNTSPYADYLHLRSYTDSSGGADNLIMFNKSGIGMRIWQQSWGSSTAYSAYADVWTTANDGAGSGLDADLLDGVQGSGYCRYYEQSTNPGSVNNGSIWNNTATGLTYQRQAGVWVQTAPGIANISIYDVNGTKVN